MPLAITNSVGFGSQTGNPTGLILVGGAVSEGLSAGLTTYTFDNAGAGFEAATPSWEISRRTVVFAVAGTASASRTISSASVAPDGDSAVTATEIITANASASVLACGWYYADVPTLVGTYTISATFSGAMLGAGVVAYQIFDFNSGSGTELVTSGDPIVNTTYIPALSYDFSLAASSGTTVTDILWGVGGVYSSDGTDVSYTGPRMFSARVVSNAISGAPFGSYAGADFNAAPTNPRLLSARISSIAQRVFA